MSRHVAQRSYMRNRWVVSDSSEVSWESCLCKRPSSFFFVKGFLLPRTLSAVIDKQLSRPFPLSNAMAQHWSPCNVLLLNFTCRHALRVRELFAYRYKPARLNSLLDECLLECCLWPAVLLHAASVDILSLQCSRKCGAQLPLRGTCSRGNLLVSQKLRPHISRQIFAAKNVHISS